MVRFASWELEVDLSHPPLFSKTKILCTPHPAKLIPLIVGILDTGMGAAAKQDLRPHYDRDIKPFYSLNAMYLPATAVCSECELRNERMPKWGFAKGVRGA